MTRRGHADDIARIVVVFGLNHRPFTDRGLLVVTQEEDDVGVTSITAGNGLSGGTITDTGTIAIDTSVTVDKTTAQALTNKTISGSSNTLSDIGASSLAASSILVFDGAYAGKALAIAVGAGDYTTSVEVVPLADMTLTGMRVWWNSAAATTLRMKIYRQSDSSELASVDVAASGAAVYTGTFSSPVSLSLGTYYFVSVRDTSGTSFTGSLGVSGPAAPAIIGNSLLGFASYYKAGAGCPDTLGSGSALYPIAPIYTVP
jgi:hypothetical protein